jgi:hypothetical protein
MNELTGLKTQTKYDILNKVLEMYRFLILKSWDRSIAPAVSPPPLQ